MATATPPLTAKAPLRLDLRGCWSLATHRLTGWALPWRVRVRVHPGGFPSGHPLFSLILPSPSRLKVLEDHGSPWPLPSSLARLQPFPLEIPR